MAPIRRNLSQPLSESEFDGKAKRTARKIKRKTKRIAKVNEKINKKQADHDSGKKKIDYDKTKGLSKTARNTRKYIKLKEKRDKLRSDVKSLKPKSTASGFGNPNTKTYIYDDPRFKEMGRDKRGVKQKKRK
jgi:hypothetical protein